MKQWQRWLGMAVIGVAIVGCAGDDAEDSGPEFKSAEEGYNMALDAMQNRKYKQAVLHFEDVERLFPYSPWAIRATLMTAYANYKVGEYEIAMAVLERFVRLHPGNELAPYAYYLLAICSYEQITDVGRDQKVTEQAQAALTEVVKRFPETAYARDAKLKLDLVDDHLAGKEMTIGRYYQKRQDHLAAINRFKYVITNYQTTSHVAEALHRLVEANLALGLREEARRNAAVLGGNFPASEWYRRSFALMQDLPAREKKKLPIPTIAEKPQAEPVPVPPVSGTDLDLPVLNNVKGGALPPLGVMPEEKKEEAKPEAQNEEKKAAPADTAGETWIERQWKSLSKVGEDKPKAKPVDAPVAVTPEEPKPVEAPAAVTAPVEPQPVPVPVETPAPLPPAESRKEAPRKLEEPKPVSVPVETKPLEEPKPVSAPVETKPAEPQPVAVPVEPQPVPVEPKKEEAKPAPVETPTVPQAVPPAPKSWIDQQWEKLPPLEKDRPAGSLPRDFVPEEPGAAPKEKPVEVKPSDAPVEKKAEPAKASDETWLERQLNSLPALGLMGDSEGETPHTIENPAAMMPPPDAAPPLPPLAAPVETKPAEAPMTAPAPAAAPLPVETNPAEVPAIAPTEPVPLDAKPVETWEQKPEEKEPAKPSKGTWIERQWKKVVE